MSTAYFNFLYLHNTTSSFPCVYASQTSFCLQRYLNSLYSLENQRAEKALFFEFQKLLAATNRAVSLCAYISTLLCQLQLIFRCYPCCLGHVWNKGCSQQPAPTVGAMENPCPPPHGLGPLCPFLL